MRLFDTGFLLERPGSEHRRIADHANRRRHILDFEQTGWRRWAGRGLRLCIQDEGYRTLDKEIYSLPEDHLRIRCGFCQDLGPRGWTRDRFCTGRETGRGDSERRSAQPSQVLEAAKKDGGRSKAITDYGKTSDLEFYAGKPVAVRYAARYDSNSRVALRGGPSFVN